MLKLNGHKYINLDMVVSITPQLGGRECVVHMYNGQSFVVEMPADQLAALLEQHEQGKLQEQAEALVDALANRFGDVVSSGSVLRVSNKHSWE